LLLLLPPPTAPLFANGLDTEENVRCRSSNKLLILLAADNDRAAAAGRGEEADRKACTIVVDGFESRIISIAFANSTIGTRTALAIIIASWAMNFQLTERSDGRSRLSRTRTADRNVDLDLWNDSSMVCESSSFVHLIILPSQSNSATPNGWLAVLFRFRCVSILFISSNVRKRKSNMQVKKAAASRDCKNVASSRME
jgi:hypothetical protein